MSVSDQKDIFGCDVGNGFGFISVLKDTKADPVAMFPAKYNLKAVGMPTSAYIVPPEGEKTEVFDGRPAYEKHKRESDKFIHAVKTRLKEGAISVPGISKPVAVDRVYAAVARDLVKLGNEERKNRGEDPIYEMVFTFPASFTNDLNLLNRMQKSIEGVKLDGHNLKVAGRLPEPAAVAIDYLYYMRNIAPPDIRITGDSCTVLVYDLGHGTFDAAVVTARSKGEPFQLHINEGLPDVGGKDFDGILYDEICKILKTGYGYVPRNNNARDIIRLTAVEIKHELSDSDRSSREISLPDGEAAVVEITREKFEEKGKMLINQTFELVDRVLQHAKKEKIKIDLVVLSGGASQMPMVISGLKQLLEGEDIAIQIYRPSEAVSYGAARYAYGRSCVTPQPAPMSESESALKLMLNANRRTAAGPARNPESKHSRKPITKPVLKPEAAPPILESYSEYSYGIWIPSENSLSGVVKVLVGSKSKLPAVSDSITLISSDSPMRLRLYRSKDKYVNNKTLDVEEQCESVMFIPFDVPANTECEIKIEVQEDYNIKVMCKPIHGSMIERNTMDRFL